MKPVSAADLVTLGAAQRARLAVEIVAAYLRVRWTVRDGTDASTAVARLRDRARASPGTWDADREVLVAWRLANAVIKTLEPLPADSRCLFRSLTLLTLMERRGMAPTLVIAVRPRPFRAHAWIEHAGHAVLPDADCGYERIVEL